MILNKVARFGSIRGATARFAAVANRQHQQQQRFSAVAAASRRAFASAVPVADDDDDVDSNSHHSTTSQTNRLMYDAVPKTDFGQHQEYSVIHTNRSLNIMSDPFGTVMRDLNTLLKTTYEADRVAIIPGSGTFGMEAVARQFAEDEHVMVLRNGWFSYRWTEIFDLGNIPKSHTVLKAQPSQVSDDEDDDDVKQYAPYPAKDVVAKIYEEEPSVFFCAHVETSTGMILPDEYIREVSEAVHDVGGLVVLDCIASGAIWANMKDLGADLVISAPQKGWTGPCCCAMVMMSDRAVQTMNDREANKNKNGSTSYSLSLAKWSNIMNKYAEHGYMYHTTMPTDALRDFHEISVETLKFGLPELKQSQYELGRKARKALEDRGLISVASDGYEAPGVLVYYSPTQQIENVDMMNAFKHAPGSLQIAMGVPWAIDEPNGLKTFRLGLFGLDKMNRIDETVATLTTALDSILLNSTSTTTTTIPKAA